MIFGVWNDEKIWHQWLIHLPTYLYTVTTLPWEIQKSHFSTVLFIQTSDYYVISEKKTNCNCCTVAYLFPYCCLLRPVICIAILWSVFYLFGQLFSKPPMPTHNRFFSESPTFGGMQHYLQSDVKVLHFTRWCGDIFQVCWVGVTICFFFWDNMNNLKCVWIISLKLTFSDFPR